MTLFKKGELYINQSRFYSQSDAYFADIFFVGQGLPHQMCPGLTLFLFIDFVDHHNKIDRPWNVIWGRFLEIKTGKLRIIANPNDRFIDATGKNLTVLAKRDRRWTRK